MRQNINVQNVHVGRLGANCGHQNVAFAWELTSNMYQLYITDYYNNCIYINIIIICSANCLRVLASLWRFSSTWAAFAQAPVLATAGRHLGLAIQLSIRFLCFPTTLEVWNISHNPVLHGYANSEGTVVVLWTTKVDNDFIGRLWARLLQLLNAIGTFL